MMSGSRSWQSETMDRMRGALSLPALDRQQLLVTVGSDSDDDQHARPVLLQADVAVEGIGPQVDVALAVQVALAPKWRTPAPRPASAERCWSPTARRRRRPESPAGRPGRRWWRSPSGGAAGSGRRYSGCAADTAAGWHCEVLLRTLVMDPRLAHRDLADPGHQLALRVLAVAYHQALALVVPQGLEVRRVLLYLQGFLKQPPGALSQPRSPAQIVDDDRRFFHERILLPVSGGMYGCLWSP